MSNGQLLRSVWQDSRGWHWTVRQGERLLAAGWFEGDSYEEQAKMRAYDWPFRKDIAYPAERLGLCSATAEENRSAEEAAFVEVQRAFARRILLECCRELGDSPLAVAGRLRAERDEASAALRDLVVYFGGEDPGPDLHLTDVVRLLEKALPFPGRSRSSQP